MTLLNSDPNNAEFIDDFKVDIHKKWNEKTEEQKRRELVSLRGWSLVRVTCMSEYLSNNSTGMD